MSETKTTPKIEVKEEMGRGINYFEKLLPIWVALCILIGIILSQIIPGISEAIDSWACAVGRLHGGILNR